MADQVLVQAYKRRVSVLAKAGLTALVMRAVDGWTCWLSVAFQEGLGFACAHAGQGAGSLSPCSARCTGG